MFFLCVVQVYVEFDDQEWEKREWVKVYEDFQLFLLEHQLVWAKRKEGAEGGAGAGGGAGGLPQGTKAKHIQWPALVRPLFSIYRQDTTSGTASHMSTLHCRYTFATVLNTMCWILLIRVTLHPHGVVFVVLDINGYWVAALPQSPPSGFVQPVLQRFWLCFWLKCHQCLAAVLGCDFWASADSYFFGYIVIWISEWWNRTLLIHDPYGFPSHDSARMWTANSLKNVTFIAWNRVLLLLLPFEIIIPPILRCKDETYVCCGLLWSKMIGKSHWFK